MLARREASRSPFSLPRRPMAAVWASLSARCCWASAALGPVLLGLGRRAIGLQRRRGLGPPQLLQLQLLARLQPGQRLRRALPGPLLLGRGRGHQPLPAHRHLLLGQLPLEGLDLRPHHAQARLLGVALQAVAITLQLQQHVPGVDRAPQAQRALHHPPRHRRVDVVGGRLHLDPRGPGQLIHRHPRQHEPADPRRQQGQARQGRHQRRPPRAIQCTRGSREHGSRIVHDGRLTEAWASTVEKAAVGLSRLCAPVDHGADRRIAVREVRWRGRGRSRGTSRSGEKTPRT
jgi:hypothetical protein